MKVFQRAIDFRKSLEAKLKNLHEKSGLDLQRLRMKFAMERFLARVFHEPNDDYFLKGGFAMELRVQKARSTKDIDLTRTSFFEQSVERQILLELQDFTTVDLEDFCHFSVLPQKGNLGTPAYGGVSFPIEARVALKPFVRFKLDVACDVILDKPEWMQVENGLDNYNMEPINIPVLSSKQQFAEKIHAYTYPWDDRENTRVKDLIDLVLLLPLPEKKTFNILSKVFKIRNTHPLPNELSLPPDHWKKPFSSLAEECGITLSLEQAFVKVSTFYKKLVSPLIFS